MNAVEVRDLSFGYKGAFVFNKLNFKVKKGTFLTIVGKNRSGKSTLFKLLTNELKGKGKITILDKTINYNLKNNNIGIISKDEYSFKKETVIDELIEALTSNGTNITNIKTSIEKISEKLGIMKILNYRIKYLNIKDKILVMFAKELLLKPKVLIIDNAFSYLDNEQKTIKTEIKRLCKKSTVINITNNPNECLWGDEVLFLKDNPTTKKVSKIDSDDFITNDLEVPFMISLTEKLQFYGLIDKEYLQMERLIDDLWQ